MKWLVADKSVVLLMGVEREELEDVTALFSSVLENLDGEESR